MPAWNPEYFLLQSTPVITSIDNEILLEKGNWLGPEFLVITGVDCIIIYVNIVPLVKLAVQYFHDQHWTKITWLLWRTLCASHHHGSIIEKEKTYFIMIAYIQIYLFYNYKWSLLSKKKLKLVGLNYLKHISNNQLFSSYNPKWIYVEGLIIYIHFLKIKLHVYTCVNTKHLSWLIVWLSRKLYQNSMA